MEILLLMRYAKKNLSIILVILLTLLLIAMVIWVFDKKIKGIENKKPGQSALIKTSNYKS